jgi:glucosyl-3-phosphoglycerate synthase
VTGLRAVIVVPARDEAQRIAGCLRALGAQRRVAPNAYEIVVVLDRCTDGTSAAAAAAAGAIAPAVRIVRSPAPGVGEARRHGMDLACARLLEADSPDGLIVSTDADTTAAEDWLAEQLALAAGGAQAIGGDIVLAGEDADALAPATIARREARGRVRLDAVLARDPTAEHHFFSGASMAVTARTYRAVGGLDPRPALEDEAFEARLLRAGVPVTRSAGVRVATAARTDGRAARGLARDLQLGEWLARRRYDGRAFDPAELRGRKGETTISVVLPARDCAATVGRVLRTAVMPFAESGLVDEVLVVDGASRDATIDRAAAAGAEVYAQNDLLPAFGPALGKGDAMWRSLSVARGDVVAFMDADTEDPDPAHLLGLLGPLLADPGVHFVKAAFERPFRTPGRLHAHEGGRVTELMARPLLNLHFPALAGFSQPLAGETAARRELLCALPFAAGYGVEVALLIDALRRVALDGLAESHVGTRQNRHQPLRDLGAMAFAVLSAVERRVPRDAADAPVAQGLVQPWDDGSVRDVPVEERPPLCGVVAREDAAPARRARSPATSRRRRARAGSGRAP